MCMACVVIRVPTRSALSTGVFGCWVGVGWDGSNPVEPAFGWRFDVGWVEPEGVYSPQMRVGVVRSNRADHSNPLRRRLGSVRGGVGDGREAELAGPGAGGAPALPSSPARGRAGGATGAGEAAEERAGATGGRRSSPAWGTGGGTPAG